MIDWTIDWNQLLILSMGPAAMVLAGVVVGLLHMREERKWAQEKKRAQTPAE